MTARESRPSRETGAFRHLLSEPSAKQIKQVTNSYSRRWDIENQYKSVKSFLPKTSSTDYRVRLFSVVFASLLYNLWRLTDYLVKVGTDRPIRSPPVVTARTFVRAVGRSLRDVG